MGEWVCERQDHFLALRFICMHLPHRCSKWLWLSMVLLEKSLFIFSCSPHHIPAHFRIYVRSLVKPVRLIVSKCKQKDRKYIWLCTWSAVHQSWMQTIMTILLCWAHFWKRNSFLYRFDLSDCNEKKKPTPWQSHFDWSNNQLTEPRNYSLGVRDVAI